MKRSIIFKYEVLLQEKFALSIPEKAQVLTAQVDQKTGKPMLWVKLNLNDRDGNIPRLFTVMGTGLMRPDQDGETLNYIATFQLNGGAFIGHLFEIVFAQDQQFNQFNP